MHEGLGREEAMRQEADSVHESYLADLGQSLLGRLEPGETLVDLANGRAFFRGHGSPDSTSGDDELWVARLGPDEADIDEAGAEARRDPADHVIALMVRDGTTSASRLRDLDEGERRGVCNSVERSLMGGDLRCATTWGQVVAEMRAHEGVTGAVCDALRKAGLGREARRPSTIPSIALECLLGDDFWSPGLGVLVTRRPDITRRGVPVAFDVWAGVTEERLAEARERQLADFPPPSTWVPTKLPSLVGHLGVDRSACVRQGDDLGVARLWALVCASDVLEGEEAVPALDAVRELRERLPALLADDGRGPDMLSREEALHWMWRGADFLTPPERAHEGVYVRCAETSGGSAVARVLTNLSVADFDDIEAYERFCEGEGAELPESLEARFNDSAYEIPLCLQGGSDAVAELIVGARMLPDGAFRLSPVARESALAITRATSETVTAESLISSARRPGVAAAPDPGSARGRGPRGGLHHG